MFNVTYEKFNLVGSTPFTLTYISGGFRGGSGASLEPSCGTKVFQFNGKIMKNLVKC